MPSTELLDIATDDGGDIQIGYNGDILVVRNEDVVSQEIQWRLKTVRGDWILEPDCGADLETLIGQPNSPKTGSQMESLIGRALTHDGFLNGEIEILRAVPVNREEIVGVISIRYGENMFTETVTIDLKEGVI
jgi:hypothetical protein